MDRKRALALLYRRLVQTLMIANDHDEEIRRLSAQDPTLFENATAEELIEDLQDAVAILRRGLQRYESAARMPHKDRWSKLLSGGPRGPGRMVRH